MDKNTVAQYATAILRALIEGGKGEIPVGEGLIYAASMDRMSLDTFRAIIQILVNGGLIVRTAGHGLMASPEAMRLVAVNA